MATLRCPNHGRCRTAGEGDDPLLARIPWRCRELQPLAVIITTPVVVVVMIAASCFTWDQKRLEEEITTRVLYVHVCRLDIWVGREEAR